MRYVVGFAFDLNGQVALIRKRRPAWQAGYLNGIGGKVEDNETYRDAMVREFKEEAGLRVEDWEQFCAMQDTQSGAFVAFYRCRGVDLSKVRTMTDEAVEVHHVDRLEREQLLPHVEWLIPMANDYFVGPNHARVNYRRGEP